MARGDEEFRFQCFSISPDGVLVDDHLVEFGTEVVRATDPAAYHVDAVAKHPHQSRCQQDHKQLQRLLCDRAPVHVRLCMCASVHMCMPHACACDAHTHMHVYMRACTHVHVRACAHAHEKMQMADATIDDTIGPGAY